MLKPIASKIRSGGRWGFAAAVLALGAACDRSSDTDVPPPEPALRGARLVVGTSAEQWSLLSLPRTGGLAEARDLSELQRVVWTGTTQLPPAIEVRPLPGGRVILRTPEGIVHTYDPLSDALVRVGDVAPRPFGWETVPSACICHPADLCSRSRETGSGPTAWIARWRGRDPPRVEYWSSWTKNLGGRPCGCSSTTRLNPPRRERPPSIRRA